MTDRRSKMTALAMTFPTLRGAAGVEPFDPGALDAWAAAGGRGSGSRHAVKFILSVWNQHGDWSSGRFSAVDAVGAWDHDHRDAFIAWCSNPWWP